MEQFKKKFLEEAQDLINSLEDILLQLEENPSDKKIIEEVFRVMHSLKGGSSMFGFQKMDAFTHELETIYDMIRNDSLKVNRDILDITLASVDHLKVLLESEEEISDAGQKNHELMLARIHSVINGDSHASPKAEKQNNEEAATQTASAQQKSTLYDQVPLYFLTIEPHEDIFRNGTNPLLLLDELSSMGHIRVYPKFFKLPPFEELEAEKCYMAWEVFLATDKSTDDIKDVFIFVEDQCTLSIFKVAETNLMTFAAFNKELDALVNSQRFLDPKAIEQFAETYQHQNKSEEAEAFRDKDLISLAKKTTINNIRVSSDKLDSLMNLVSELVTTQASLSLFAENNDMPELNAIAENIEKLSRQLRDNTFEICLIPIETIMTRFKRLVRDLSNELDKEIQFVAEGTETELDKSVIEGLTEPLMHIFRNAIDHGIEGADERMAKGKPRQGKIILKAFYSGTNVYVQIRDDGRGIDVEKIRQKAITRGFIAPEANLSYKDLLNLVFLPGFSTAAKVTEVSGRGVGLDVVVKKISDIRGDVEIESQLGVGTTITIKLPLTLSIIDGLLVKIDTTYFVLPLSSVDKCFEVSDDEIRNAFNSRAVLDGQQLTFVNLRKEFDIQENRPDLHQMIRVHYEDYKVGLSVDTIIGEYQAVLKPLGRLFKEQEIISGATILGDGTIALVLDPAKIISTFDRESILKREKFYKELGIKQGALEK